MAAVLCHPTSGYGLNEGPLRVGKSQPTIKGTVIGERLQCGPWLVAQAEFQPDALRPRMPAIRPVPDYRHPGGVFPESAANGVNRRIGQKAFGAAIAVDEHLDVIFIHGLPQQMLKTGGIRDVVIDFHPEPGFIAFFQQPSGHA